jgi:undecaprenyl pyrophosphate phosphatase UppP
MSRTVWIVIGVIVAIVIAWFLVDIVFSVLWFIAKLAIVLVVAAVVFFALRSLLKRVGDNRRSIER